MKSAKIVGIVFAVCGILFAIIGTVSGIVRLMEKDDCKYATAYIVKIDEKKTGDPEFPIEHTTYVEFDINGIQVSILEKKLKCTTLKTICKRYMKMGVKLFS